MSDKKSRTRERILEAARTALIQHGPAEPSVSQVMGAAGLTVGGFYAHFDSKDELMLEAFRQLLGERRALLAQIDPNLDGAGRRSAGQGLLPLAQAPGLRSTCLPAA